MINWLLFLGLILLAGCSPEEAKAVVSQAEPSHILPFNVINTNQATSYLPHHLTWGYDSDLPVDNVEFDIEHRFGLEEPWVLFCRTNQPPVYFDYTTNKEFFRVGAHYITNVNDIPLTGPVTTN